MSSQVSGAGVQDRPAGGERFHETSARERAVCAKQLATPTRGQASEPSRRGPRTIWTIDRRLCNQSDCRGARPAPGDERSGPDRTRPRRWAARWPERRRARGRNCRPAGGGRRWSGQSRLAALTCGLIQLHYKRGFVKTHTHTHTSPETEAHTRRRALRERHARRIAASRRRARRAQFVLPT